MTEITVDYNKTNQSIASNGTLLVVYYPKLVRFYEAHDGSHLG
jgi:hypothetical protein